MEVNETKLEMHVLMVAFSAQGHINPMLRLGKRLVSKGLNVTLATTEITRQRMLNSSTITTTTDTISGVKLLFFSDGLSLDYNRGADLDYYMECLDKHGPINLTKMIKEQYPNNDSNKKLLCLINNPFVPWVVDVANDLQIPCAMLWIQPCSLFSIYYRFYKNINQFPTITNTNISVQLPGLPLLSTQDLPTFILPSNTFGSLPKLLQELFTTLNKYTWVIANSFYELEKDVIDSINDLSPVRPVGPLVPSSLLAEKEDQEIGFEMWKAEDTCLEWLNHQASSSVVYVSFGSISMLPPKQMEAIALALKNTKRPFIWVAKQRDGPSEQLPSGFLEDTKNQGIVVSWSPQTKVLAHKAIGCFITHCGWNSMSETIAAGVPVIAYPQWTDQPTNAKLIVDVFGIGLRLSPGEDGIVGNKQIERSVEDIMDGPKSEEVKSNARKLKLAAREAVAVGGSSDRNIQWFVDEIKKGVVSSGVDGGCGLESVMGINNCVEDNQDQDKL